MFSSVLCCGLFLSRSCLITLLADHEIGLFLLFQPKSQFISMKPLLSSYFIIELQGDTKYLIYTALRGSFGFNLDLT